MDRRLPRDAARVAATVAGALLSILLVTAAAAAEVTTMAPDVVASYSEAQPQADYVKRFVRSRIACGGQIGMRADGIRA